MNKFAKNIKNLIFLFIFSLFIIALSGCRTFIVDPKVPLEKVELNFLNIRFFDEEEKSLKTIMPSPKRFDGIVKFSVSDNLKNIVEIEPKTIDDNEKFKFKFKEDVLLSFPNLIKIKNDLSEYDRQIEIFNLNLYNERKKVKNEKATLNIENQSDLEKIKKLDEDLILLEIEINNKIKEFQTKIIEAKQQLNLELKNELASSSSKLIEGEIYIFNSHDVKVGTIKLRIDKSSQNLEREIASLNANLFPLNKTNILPPDFKILPQDKKNEYINKLEINKKFISVDDYQKMANILTEAQDVLINKDSTQISFLYYENLLKESNNKLNSILIEGKKMPEYSRNAAIISLSLYTGLMVIAIVMLGVVFIVKNKKSKSKDNEN